jgi:hypothetical protein
VTDVEFAAAVHANGETEAGAGIETTDEKDAVIALRMMITSCLLHRGLLPASRMRKRHGDRQRICIPTDGIGIEVHHLCKAVIGVFEVEVGEAKVGALSSWKVEENNEKWRL